MKGLGTTAVSAILLLALAGAGCDDGGSAPGDDDVVSCLEPAAGAAWPAADAVIGCGDAVTGDDDVLEGVEAATG